MTRTVLGEGLSARRAILYGTVLVGLLDILDAIVFFGTVRDVPPIVILQSIASSLLGRAA